MLSTPNQLPTLGYLHKVVCDCLGLWNSDNEDITFHVSATEKEIRTQLRQAFETIKRDDGPLCHSSCPVKFVSIFQHEGAILQGSR